MSLYDVTTQEKGFKMRKMQFGIYANENDFLTLCANLNGWIGIKFDEVSRVQYFVLKNLRGEYFKNKYVDYYIVKFHATEETFEEFCNTNEITNERQWW